MMRIHYSIRIGFLWTVVLFGACNHRSVYEDYQEVVDNSWHYNEPAVFEFKVEDTDPFYSLFLHIRHGGKYRYSNLFVQFSMETPSGVRKEERIEITLANPDGRWLGSGLGDLFEASYPVNEYLQLKEKGVYTVQIKQYMRDDPLMHIEDIGLSLEIRADNDELQPRKEFQ